MKLIPIILLLLSAAACSAQTPNYSFYGRTDTTVCAFNASAPTMGTGLSGAGTIVNGDSCFTAPILRVTDNGTDPSRPGHNYMGDTSGSAEVNLWNADDTCFFTGESGGPTIPWTFNPSTMTASRIYAASFPSTGGILFLSGTYPYQRSGNFDHVKGHCTFISLNETNWHLESVDLTQVSPPTPAQIGTSNAQAATCGNGNLVANDVWFSNLDAADNRLLIYGGGATGHQSQDTWDTACVYDISLGGWWSVNMVTGVIAGDWGSTGTVNVNGCGTAGTCDRFGFHNVRMSLDGNWLQVTQGTCITTCTGSNKSYWIQVGTTTMYPATNVEAASGHRCLGYTHFFNGDTLAGPIYQYYTNLLSNHGSIAPTNLNNVYAGAIPDQHCSCNNENPSDTNMVLDSSEESVSWGSSVTVAWDGEVRGVAADGSGKVFRFAHTYTNSVPAVNFNATQAIGSVSQTGRFFLFTSYWGGTLGSTDGVSNTCTYSSGGNCRSDAFIVQLAPLTSVTTSPSSLIIAIQ